MIKVAAAGAIDGRGADAVGDIFGVDATDTVAVAVLDVVGRHSKLVVVESGDVMVRFEVDLKQSVNFPSQVLRSHFTVGRMTVKDEVLRAHPRQSRPLVSVLVAW